MLSKAMKNFKNIIRMTMVALAAMVFTACGEKEPIGNGDGFMQINPAWNISYAGPSKIDGVSHKHTVAVISTDNNPYTVVTVYADEFQTSKLKEFGELLIQDMLDYLKEYNAAYDTSYVLADLLDSGSTMISLDDPYPGEYISIAIGITPEGELSGLYAASKPFVIEEEVPTADYTEWLGDWVFNGDNNQSNNITISRKVANRQIYLTGLMGLPFSIVGEYSVERNDIIFSAQVVEKDYKFSDGRVGDVLLLGVDRDNQFYGLNNGNYAIAIAGVYDNGVRSIVRYGVNSYGYPKFVAMFLIAYVDGEYLEIGMGNPLPTFSGWSELAPAGTSTSSVTPNQLSLGRKVEVVNF